MCVHRYFSAETDEEFDKWSGELKQRMRLADTAKAEETISRNASFATPRSSQTTDDGHHGIVFHTIRNARIKNVGKYQSCMV